MKRGKRRTKAEMYPMVTEWLNSGQNKEAFCEAQQVNMHTFTYWYGKYRAEKVQTSAPAFVRLDKPELSDSGSYFIIRYPHGVQLQVNTLLTSGELSKLIYLARP
jgi:hypothetical protein